MDAKNVFGEKLIDDVAEMIWDDGDRILPEELAIKILERAVREWRGAHGLPHDPLSDRLSRMLSQGDALDFESLFRDHCESRRRVAEQAAPISGGRVESFWSLIKRAACRARNAEL